MPHHLLRSCKVKPWMPGRITPLDNLSIGFISFLDSWQANHLEFPDNLTVGLYELSTEISTKQK